MPTWTTFDSTQIEHDQDFSNLPTISTVTDIHKVVMSHLAYGTRHDQLTSRIRFKRSTDATLKAGLPYDTPRVLFYNQNDRTKLLTKSPVIVFQPRVPLPFSEAIQNYQVFETIELESGEAQVVITEAPVYHEFHYQITMGATEADLFYRLQTFLRHQLFPAVRGTNLIVLEVDPTKPTDRSLMNIRELTVLDEGNSEDLENNWMQYDITYRFYLSLYVGACVTVPTAAGVPANVEVCEYTVTLDNLETRGISGIYYNQTVDGVTSEVLLELEGYPFNHNSPGLLSEQLEPFALGHTLIFPTSTSITLSFANSYLSLTKVTYTDDTEVLFTGPTNCRTVSHPLGSSNKLIVGGLKDSYGSVPPGTTYVGVGFTQEKAIVNSMRNIGSVGANYGLNFGKEDWSFGQGNSSDKLGINVKIK